jgi:hypothetical protein
VRKSIHLLVVAGVVFICGAMPASVTATQVTIIFNDATNTLSVSGLSGTTCGVSSFPVWGGSSSIPFEFCAGSILAPSGAHLNSAASLPFLNFIGGEGIGNNAKVSDSFGYLPVLGTYGAVKSINFIFLSDLPNSLGLGGAGVRCAYVGGCAFTETGMVQNLGDIIWSDGTVEHIKFQSGLVTAPEPASLLLFGSGLGITAWFLRRRRRLVTPSF